MSNHPPRWLPDRERAVYEDTAARIAHYTPELDGPALLQAERDENTCRLDFSPAEAVAIGRAIEDRERAEAKARMTHANDTYGNLPQVSLGPTRDKVGAALGMSGKSYEKAKRAAG